MGKLTNKGKHIVKVVNHSHTNMISKPAIVKREYKCKILLTHLKLRDEHLKTTVYVCVCVCVFLYQNPLVTTDQKMTVDTKTNKRKQFEHNTKDTHQITRE